MEMLAVVVQSVIPALGRWRQEDTKFEASLIYIAILVQYWPLTLSQKKKIITKDTRIAMYSWY
jgi:hypothetical protein